MTNLKEDNFLDVTFDLTNGTFRPYKKTIDKLLYIHTSPVHPPQIIKQLPYAINERSSHNSSDEQYSIPQKLNIKMTRSKEEQLQSKP